jgi:hypothetical protein
MTSSARIGKIAAGSLVLAVLATSPSMLRAQGLRSAPASVSLIVVVPPRPAAPLRELRQVEQRMVGRGVMEVSAFVGFVGEPVSRVDVARADAPTAGMHELLGRDAEGRMVRIDGRTRLALTPDESAGSRVELRVMLDTTATAPAHIPLRYRVTLGRGERARVVEYTDTLSLSSDR